MPSLICSLRSSGAAAPSLRAALRRMRRESVERELEGCQMVAGLWCHCLTVRQIQCLRGALPKSAKLVVAKNTLLGKSTDGTSWESIRSCARGMNAWLFVRSEDEVAAALKACRDFQRQWKLDLNDFTGAVFQGRLYGPQDFGVLETSPAKADSNAYLLGSLQLPAASLIGLLQAFQESISSADVAVSSAAGADTTGSPAPAPASD
ncbi:50S ribosomal protein L10, chloroplastic-like [Phalaenopsis equestris]|uniref:50S ribosomal protein L10, chloroplastic-like n=1 Tax=Phalaenopsis equestris TaxID=78828 RepID=UPI0009E4489B|nr:50S ribosomal protein L10, chloroplastic-like [Phalaenopsis equestris]XP_020580412.1 50S ribosomal protein L10, chloroplastic-like [Phalaenopsis equestris]XP_020580421.1 50S ribosomal protein L10, chloroplastic-like [Phalaenopsis equestris]